MLRGAVGNYFKCLVYVFVALGCIMLGALFGLSVLWETLSAQAALLSGEIGELVPDAQTQVDELLVVLLSAVRKLDWSNAVDTILSTDWLSDLLAEFFRLSETASAELSARLGETLQEVSAALTAAVVLFALFVAFGVMLGDLVTNYFVRRVTVRRGFRRFWLYTVADAAISATIVAFTLWLLAVWDPGVLISSAVGILLSGFVALFEAYLLYGRGKIALRSVMTLKNCLMLFVSQVCIYLMSVFLVLLILLVTNAVVTIALGTSVMTIALLVVNVNAEWFVYRRANGLDRELHALPAPDFRQ